MHEKFQFGLVYSNSSFPSFREDGCRILGLARSDLVSFSRPPPKHTEYDISGVWTVFSLPISFILTYNMTLCRSLPPLSPHLPTERMRWVAIKHLANIEGDKEAGKGRLMEPIKKKSIKAQLINLNCFLVG